MPDLCQSCHERRWAVIILLPLKYWCWVCYVKYKRPEP
jgi:hypothetical protein